VNDKDRQTLETLKYSQKNPAINASTPIAIPKADRPNAIMSNPMVDSLSFEMMFKTMMVTIPITKTNRPANIAAHNPAEKILM
jgi:hypothetical protein